MPKNFDKEENNISSEFLSKSQKKAVIFLAVAAVLIFTLGVWQFRAQVNRPFFYDSKGNKLAVDTSSINPDDILKNMDTDEDGLSDYDEIYVYKTSPYLEDTDSDGIDDKEEAERGTDPNCAAGTNCDLGIEIVTSDDSILSEIEIKNTEDPKANSDEDALQNILNGTIDAAGLRAVLLTGGMTEEELAGISDEDLMASYQEALLSQDQTE